MTGAVWLRVRGLFPCLHQEGVEAYSLPLTGVGSLVLSVKMEVLGEKPTGRLFRAGFLVPQVGSVLKESAGVSKSNVQRNKYSFLLPPFQILGSAHKFSQT